MSREGLGLRLRARELSLVAGLSALLIVASTVPPSAALGGLSFMSFGAILVPVIAWVLKPKEALVCSVVGSLGIYALQVGIAPVLGPFSLIVPFSGIFLGSLGFHYKFGGVIPWAYILLGTAYLGAMSRSILYITPYLGTVGVFLLLLRFARLRVPMLCLYSTTCELTTINLAAIFILKLPGLAWSLVALSLFLEGGLAAIGSVLLIAGLSRKLPSIVRDDHFN
jgi:hypothetical protein